MLNALSCMSAGLRSLTLDNLPISSSNQNHSATLVPLPALNFIHLAGLAKDCAYLLRHLIFSSELTTFNAFCGVETECEPLFEWIADSFPGGKSRAYTQDHDAKPENGLMRRLRIRKLRYARNKTFVFEGWTGASMTKASPMPDSSSLVLTDGEEDNESNNNPQLAISFVRN